MQHAAGNLVDQKTPNDGQIVNQRRWRQTTFGTQKSRELANKLTHGTRIHFQRRRLNATEITQISEQLLAGGHVAAPLPVAMILVKLAKTRLVEPVQRRIAIAGKSKREEWLPLTQEVGDAIIAYIEQARPRLPTSRLFSSDLAPIRPLTRVAVRCIVRRALLRAGIKSAHRGAHVLRHSAATAMLRQGISLSGVGAVLRHRSPGMTQHYAKVDFGLLSEIAQPWAGRLPC